MRPRLVAAKRPSGGKRATAYPVARRLPPHPDRAARDARQHDEQHDMSGGRPGRVALVTGATGGLGPAVVRAFLEDGAAVVGTFRDAAAGERARRELGAGDERVVFERADLTDRGVVERLVEGTLARWGRLDYLINVAGGWAGGRPMWETEDDEREGMASANR